MTEKIIEMLEVKKGCVPIEYIGTFNALNGTLSFLRKRLSCVTSIGFSEKPYFSIGRNSSGGDENEDYISLDKENTEDFALRQEVIDFLICKVIEQINSVVTKMNNIIKEN